MFLDMLSIFKWSFCLRMRIVSGSFCMNKFRWYQDSPKGLIFRVFLGANHLPKLANIRLFPITFMLKVQIPYFARIQFKGLLRNHMRGAWWKNWGQGFLYLCNLSSYYLTSIWNHSAEFNALPEKLCEIYDFMN